MRFFFAIAFLLLAADFSQSAYSIWTGFLSIGILACIITVNYNKIKKLLLKNKNRLLLIVIVFIALMIVSYFRTNFKSGLSYSVARALKLILTFGGALGFFIHITRQKIYKDTDKVFFRIITIPLLFILVNLFLRLISFDVFGIIKKYPDLGIANTIYSLTGIAIRRVPFPLSNGLNTYGTFLGAILVLSGSFFLTATNRLLKGYSLFISVVSLICLVLVDTRSAQLAFVFLAIGTAIIKPATYLNHSRKLIWILGLVPVILVLTGTLFKNAELFSFISRDSSNDIGSGGNRKIIWTFCFQEMANFKLMHIIGFGEFGQVGSKISNLWADNYSVFENSIYVSAHNNTFQIFLDIGYLGVIVYYALLITISNYIFRMFKHSGDSNLIIFQNFLLYVSIIGGTEAVNSILPTFYLLIIIIACVILYPKRILIVK